MRKAFVAFAAAVMAASAFASDIGAASKAVPLRDGSTVYIFPDGKMAMENKWGRAEFMKPGQVMETRDGQSLVMVGNEVARLNRLLQEAYEPSGG